MLIVHIIKGLPASGKSSWSKEQLAKNPNGLKRVNKDDLRAMLDNRKHSKDAEKFVLTVRNSIIWEALKNGKHVIVDDTNLDPKHEKEIRELVYNFNNSGGLLGTNQQAKVEIVDFTNVTPAECIERDSKRTGFEKVGPEVIMGMYNRYLRPKEVEMRPKLDLKYDPNLVNAIICDVDGTLALNVTRGPFDTSKYHEDALNEPVARMVMSWVKHEKGNDGVNLIIMSGREEKFKEVTSDWLLKNGISFDWIFMRPTGDKRNDGIIKRELFEQNVAGKFNVLAVIDDRNRVVKVWRELGLPCFQVADGEF